jgi:hypothetical protein
MGRTPPSSYEVTSRLTAGAARKADRSTSGHAASRDQGSDPPSGLDTLTIEPDGMVDDLGRKTVGGVCDRLGRHPASMARPTHSGQSRKT